MSAGTPSTAEWDLDDAQPRPTSGSPSRLGGHILVLLLTLSGLGAGALTNSLLSRTTSTRPPVASLAIRDLGLNDAGAPVATLRLLVENPGPDVVRLATLAVEGVGRSRITQPVNLDLPADGSVVVDLAVYPQCSGSDTPWTHLLAGLSVSAPGQAGSVPVALVGELVEHGGLCFRFGTDLPAGWQAPVLATEVRRKGPDLQVTVPNLEAYTVGSTSLGGELLPTVFIGNRLVSASVPLNAGAPSALLLRGPPGCGRGTSSEPIPTSLRLLKAGPLGLEPVLVVVGPELSRWLLTRCV